MPLNSELNSGRLFLSRVFQDSPERFPSLNKADPAGRYRRIKFLKLKMIKIKLIEVQSLDSKPRELIELEKSSPYLAATLEILYCDEQQR